MDFRHERPGESQAVAIRASGPALSAARCVPALSNLADDPGGLRGRGWVYAGPPDPGLQGPADDRGAGQRRNDCRGDDGTLDPDRAPARVRVGAVSVPVQGGLQCGDPGAADPAAVRRGVGGEGDHGARGGPERAPGHGVRSSGIGTPRRRRRGRGPAPLPHHLPERDGGPGQHRSGAGRGGRERRREAGEAILQDHAPPDPAGPLRGLDDRVHLVADGARHAARVRLHPRHAGSDLRIVAAGRELGAPVCAHRGAARRGGAALRGGAGRLRSSGPRDVREGVSGVDGASAQSLGDGVRARRLHAGDAACAAAARRGGAHEPVRDRRVVSHRDSVFVHARPLSHRPERRGRLRFGRQQRQVRLDRDGPGHRPRSADRVPDRAHDAAWKRRCSTRCACSRWRCRGW